MFTHYTFKPAFLNLYRVIDFLFEKIEDEKIAEQRAKLRE